MKFNEILPLMKNGEIFKRPSWRGYWYWDSDKQTVIMRCVPEQSDTGRELVDIRETKRVEYTLTNLLADDWIKATPKNTPLLGGVATFDFNTALGYLKRGFKLTRVSWLNHINNAKNIEPGNTANTAYDWRQQYIYLDENDEQLYGSFINPFRPFHKPKIIQYNFQSIIELDATDWTIYNEE